VIDDINDSGHTFWQVDKCIRDHAINSSHGRKNIYFAALINNTSSSFPGVSFSGSDITKNRGEDDPWYIFPWETSASTKTST